jgi:ankyrin repeat protein
MLKLTILCTAVAVALSATLRSAQTAPADKADALSAAARRGDAAAVKKLLDEGVDVNTKYRYGVTALTYACDHGYPEVVKMLLERGADVNVKDTFYGFTPLAIAVSPAQKRKPEHNEIVKLLLAKGAAGKDAALLEAAGEPDAVLMKILLDAGGFQPNTLSAALESATNEKHPEIVALLQQAGAKPFPEVKLEEAQLARYAGKYRSPAGNELVWAVADGKLVGGPAGQKLTLAPTDEKTFRVLSAQGATLVFQVEDGKVTGLTVTQGGSATTYSRVEK